MAAQPAMAVAQDGAAWRAYVRGRMAISQDRLSEAARQFQIALGASASDRLLQQRTFGLALLAGDEKLSRDLALQLEKGGDKGFDTRLVLLGVAVQKGKWADAAAIRNQLSAENQLLFALPVIDAWLALGKGGDPFIPIANVGRNALANSYMAEHRAFLLGATGKIDEALAEYQPLIAGDSGRAVRIRLAAAAMLQKAGRKHQALEMLAGDSPSLKIARDQISSGVTLRMGVATPAQGIAELFARLAADVSRERVSQAGFTLGRLATFLAPGNAEGWLVMANMLANDDKPEAALEAVGHIVPTDPFAVQMNALRIVLLQRLGRDEEALGIAQAAAARPDAGTAEWAQLGDLLAAVDRNPDAADAYGKALAAAPSGARPWSIYLLRGGAYERAGDWKRAEPDLRQAVALAPDQATTLNYLGYALLDRGVKLDEARQLIERASALRPDDGAITDSLAWVYYRQGDYPRAAELLEKAVRIEPAEPTINEHLGDAYWRLGRKREARYSWRAALVGTEDKPVIERLQRKVDFGLEAGTTRGF